MSTRFMVNLADVPLRDFGTGRAFAARLGRVGPLIGARKLGCQLHIVPAGKKAFPRHAHHANEEMFFILSGAGTYCVGAESFPIRANDVIAAPAGDGETAHQIVNTGGDELRYLAFSTRKDPDVVEYPDSGKFAVASMIPEDKGLLGARALHWPNGWAVSRLLRRRRVTVMLQIQNLQISVGERDSQCPLAHYKGWRGRE